MNSFKVVYDGTDTTVVRSLKEPDGVNYHKLKSVAIGEAKMYLKDRINAYRQQLAEVSKLRVPDMVFEHDS